MKPKRAIRLPPRIGRTTRSESTAARRLASISHAPVILVVDVDPALVALLAEWLSETGCDVADARIVADSHAARYDMVIVDVPFPRQDGARPVAEIAVRYPGLPIIAMSAAFFPGACGRPEVARMVGANLALPKPLIRRDLLAAVHQLLKR